MLVVFALTEAMTVVVIVFAVDFETGFLFAL